MDNIITLQLTPEQAEMLKLCLLDSLNSDNETRAKYARLFIDTLNGVDNKETV